MKDKKILSLFCAAALTLSLAACGSKTSDYSGQTITGEITDIDGTAVTMQLGELSEGGMPSDDVSDSSDSDQTPPDKPDGEINITFVFDASGLKTATEIVVFETLYRDDTEIAAHADLKDEGQTVKITPPTPDNPQTGDNSNLGFWIGLGAVALGGVIACAVMYFKRKKDEDDE